MSELLFAPTRRLMKNSGANRVSEDAVNYLNETLEERGVSITKEASKLAAHAGRQTVMIDDIKMAIGKQL